MKLPYTTKWDEYYDLSINEETGSPNDPRPFQRWIDREGIEYIFVPDWPLLLDDDASDEEILEAYTKHHDYGGEGITWEYKDYKRFSDTFQPQKYEKLRLFNRCINWCGNLRIFSRSNVVHQRAKL